MPDRIQLITKQVLLAADDPDAGHRANCLWLLGEVERLRLLGERWQCETCGCEFLAGKFDDGVVRCSKCVEVEVLREAAKEMRDIVDKLPKLANGEPVVPGMRLWTSYNGGRDVTGFETRDGRLTCLHFRDGFDCCTWAHHDTREAAEAARKES